MSYSVCKNPNPMHLNEFSHEQANKMLEKQIEKEINKAKEKKKCGFTDFHQVNNAHKNKRVKMIMENHIAAAIFEFLASAMDDYNAVVCSYTVLQEALGMSKATIQRAVAYLKDNDFVYVAKSGTTNVYILNPELVWNSWGTNREYCKFPANVIISQTENKELQIKTTKEKKLIIKESKPQPEKTSS